VYKYDQVPDSTIYGTTDQFRVLYSDAYWSDGLKNLTNEDGSLAWLKSQDMMALVQMYDLTGERWYLDWLGRYVREAIQVRDDVAGRKDTNGSLLPGWGSSRYGDGKRRVYLVHSGLIVEPILEYVLRARQVEGVDSRELDKMVAQCRETLLFHDYQIDPASPEGQTVYLSGKEEPDRRNEWQPFNRQNLFARDFYLLYKATGDETFKERSSKLYAFFRTHIELTPSDAYIWEYEPLRFVPLPVKVLACDDLSHASYTIAPVFAAARDNFMFGQEDMRRLANTFMKYVYLGDGVFRTSIGCRVSFTQRYMDRIYAWLPLARTDPRVYEVLHRFYMYNVAKPPPLAVAYFAAYRPKGMSGLDTRIK
jgi:hypothetical protein